MELTDNIRERMDPADRAKLPIKQRFTAKETSQRNEKKREIEMHNEFAQWLRMRKHIFEFVHADPTRRATIAKGWPDFTIFSIEPRPLLIEFKVFETGILSQDQLDRFGNLFRLHHEVFVCTSVGDAIDQVLEFFHLTTGDLDNEHE